MTPSEHQAPKAPLQGLAGDYEAALQGLLPNRTELQLLRACLSEPRAAAQSWTDFVSTVSDPKAFFEANQTGLKGLLPFVESSLARNGIDAGSAFHTYARVASVREDLRSRIYAEVLGAVLAALGDAGIASILLKGGALSATVYPQPSSRHNHAIDLWVDERDMGAAATVLQDHQISPQRSVAGAADHRNFRHTNGLALALHSRFLFLPHFDMPLDDVVGRARTVPLDNATARVLSPEDALVHVCGHAIYSRKRANLRWACDAFYLLERNPALNWHGLIRTAERSRLALPLYVLLRWLRDALAAPVPADALAELADRGGAIDAVTAEGMCAALLHSCESRRAAFGPARGRSTTAWAFLKFSALPSARYMRWRYDVRHDWALPFYHVSRAARFGWRLVGRRFGATAIPEADAGNGASEERIAT